MVHIKFLSAAFIGTLVYVSVSVVFGRNGAVVYDHLQTQKKEIAAATEAIQKINAELELEYTALLKDKDVIAAYARRLDYVSAGEKLVKITGMQQFQKTLYDTGTALKRADAYYIPEHICKITGALFFACSFLLMLLIDIAQRYPAAAPHVQRQERAYDMPKI